MSRYDAEILIDGGRVYGYNSFLRVIASCMWAVSSAGRAGDF